MRLSSLLWRAKEGKYAVPACNVFDAVSMDAVLAAAERRSSPVIVQVSVRTVHLWGPSRIQAMFEAMRSQRHVVATLHLDHCSDPDLVVAVMDAGWNSALFDASGMELHRAIRLTRDLVVRGADRGFDVEGEIQAIGSATADSGVDAVTDIETSAIFVERTGVACFSPAIGTVHGVPRGELRLDWAGLRELAGRIGLPMVLHGASGVDEYVVRRLIDHGIAKVNYSTVLKAAFRSVLDRHRELPFDEPLEFARHVRREISQVVAACIDAVESGDRAWIGQTGEPPTSRRSASDGAISTSGTPPRET